MGHSTGVNRVNVIYISASQLKLAECIRKWAGVYLWKMKPLVEPAAFAFGTAFHSEAQAYLDQRPGYGDPVFEAMLDNGKSLLPEPGTVETETYIKFPLLPEEDGLPAVWVRGYVDFLIPGKLIGDHKTTSTGASSPWVLTEETLVRNVQACFYAHEQFLQHPALPDIMLRWVYYGKKPPHGAWSVSARITREQAEAVVESIKPLARTLRGLRLVVDTETDDLNELPLDITACKFCEVAVACNKLQPCVSNNDIDQLIQLRLMHTSTKR